MYNFRPKFMLVCFTMVLFSGKDAHAMRLLTPTPLACQDVIGRSGSFRYVQRRTLPEPPVCLTMFRAPVDKNIELIIETRNVSCERAGEIAFIDGLNLKNDYFPGLSEGEVPAHKRIAVLCDAMGPQKFVSHQNVATIIFRFPRAGRAFVVNARFVPNPEPCNIVAPHPNATGLLKLQNFGHRRNCSYLILYPTKFAVMDAKVGSGYDKKCTTGTDFFEIRSGGNIDPLKSTERVTDSCQYAMTKRVSGVAGPMIASSPCYASVVRLVSSGRTNNEVLIKHKPMDLREADQFCPMQ